MKLWRISNHRNLSGAGGRRAGGRWHSPGRPIVYCAEHPASALLEILAHFDLPSLTALPDGYQLLEIDAPDAVAIDTLSAQALPPRWQSDETVTRAIGDRWLQSGRYALLRVPSALVPKVWNYLLNPEHADAARLKTVSVARYPFDTRLFKLVGGTGPRAATRRRRRRPTPR